MFWSKVLVVFEGHSAAIYIKSFPRCFLSLSLPPSGFYAHVGVESSCGKETERCNFCPYPSQKLGTDELLLRTGKKRIWWKEALNFLVSLGTSPVLQGDLQVFGTWCVQETTQVLSVNDTSLSVIHIKKIPKSVQNGCVWIIYRAYNNLPMTCFLVVEDQSSDTIFIKVQGKLKSSSFVSFFLVKANSKELQSGEIMSELRITGRNLAQFLGSIAILQT